MAVWRFDGTPRTARQCTVYKHCPLPAPEDRLFCLLTYLKICAPGRPRTPLRHASMSSRSVDARPAARAAHDPARPRRCPHALPRGPGAPSAPRTRLNRKTVIAARKKITSRQGKLETSELRSTS
jgi:hypothetical protein